MSSIGVRRPVRSLFPSFETTGENEYIVSWRIRDWDMIHRIQEYFGMPRYTTLNRLSKITIKRDDPKWETFVEGVRKGFYWAYKTPNVSKR